MSKKNLSQLSDEELLKNEKIVKTVTGMLAGAIFVLFVINIFLAFKKGFSSLSVIPIALLPIALLNINSLKEIKKEIKSRNL
ncbi:redox-active disulfide protein 2 [Pedobacter frigiditerrae]|uniref:redox-active disulfide protein 2 n=1 Tax=Pedobacter frigiditerrae TaxID=2530452 RepID=UPI00292EFA67|nr:redox-active disulfide protein 2 [Pedobacter frigiditerrae]